MDRIDRAVGEWHRVYAQLSAARERLRNSDSTYSGFATAPDELARDVERLQDQEELALRAVREALISAKEALFRRSGRSPSAGKEPS